VLQFIFLADGTGMVTNGIVATEEEDYSPMTWSEEAGSIMMSVDTEGDSMLQSYELGGMLTTTDSSIAGTSYGPLTCIPMPLN
jgi:hypothetical protein